MPLKKAQAIKIISRYTTADEAEALLEAAYQAAPPFCGTGRVSKVFAGQKFPATGIGKTANGDTRVNIAWSPSGYEVTTSPVAKQL